MLVVYMIKSVNSLEWVIEQLVQNKKIISRLAESELLQQRKKTSSNRMISNGGSPR